MKSKFTPRILAMTAGMIITLGFLPATTFAQGTAFTYQGRLNDGAGAANGSYDVRFVIYDAQALGTQQGPILTNAATAVSNGLFTVTLDFGNQFPGTDRWLEIGVRTNGGGSFSTLIPRQPITSTPYAVFAGNAATIAGSISAGQITGTLPPSLLPAGVVTNGATGVSISGTFAGNGAGLINVPGAIPSQTVPGTNVSAQPNVVYVSTNAAAVTFTLPANASLGDVVRVDGVGAGGWQVQAGAGQFINQYSAGSVWIARETNRGWGAVAASADGSKLVAGVSGGGQIFTSTDAGTNWIARESFQYWRAVASSADGSKLVAVVGADFILGQIYTSTDSGTNWVPRATTNNWWSVASSTDGSKLVAVAKGGQIYTSTDSGTNWLARDSNRYWVSVASSADGNTLAAVVGNGQIYISTDSGTNWTARENNRSWMSVAASADGSKLVAVTFGGPIFTSTDSGLNWAPRESSRSWMAVASSADGINLVAVESGGLIYISVDSGISWHARASNRSWRAVASSADGSRLVAVVYPSQIYTSSAIPLGGAQGATVELQNAGNGVWQRLNGPEASSPFTGPLPDTQLSPNVALLSVNQTFTGQNILNNAANSFAGNGSALTGLSAANVTSGTVADARLSSNIALRSGGNAFTGTQIITGGSVGIGITPQSTLDVNGTARIDGANNWNVSGSEGDFRVGNDSFRFKIGVANGGGGAGDVWMRAHGGTARVFIKTPGGTTFFSNEGETAGVSLAANGTSWAVVSDRNVKKDFAKVDHRMILEKLAAMPITQWHYNWESADVTPHIGPMAQDFKAAFYPGADDKSITTQEADGVALAAIQGLNQKLEETRAENAELKQQLSELKQLVQTLVLKH